MSRFEQVVIKDNDTPANKLRIKDNGSIDVNIQDQITIPVDFFFQQILGAPTTVAVATAIDDLTVTVTSAAGCSVGDYFGMFNSDSATDNRAYFGTITNIAGNVITLDTPIDFAFQIGDTAACFTRDMNVDGSVTSQIFAVQVGGGATQSIDITRLVIHILDGTSMDDSTFGGITALTNGVVLRRVNGVIHNIWNVKSNGEFGELAYDKNYDDKAPAGSYGITIRYTLAGPSKHGVAIRLDPGDELQLIIQDDLTGLEKFRITAEGHYVDP